MDHLQFDSVSNKIGSLSFCFKLQSRFKIEVETDAKKLDWLKISPIVKKLQFLSDQAEIQAILPTHELFILTKFHKDWQKIVDFLLIVEF